LKIWNVDSGQLINTLEGHTDQIKTLSFSPNGNSYNIQPPLILWDAKTGKQLWSKEESVYFISFSPDNKRLVVNKDVNPTLEYLEIWEDLGDRKWSDYPYARGTYRPCSFCHFQP
jgi:WD domain, G-beta repeat.